MGKWHLGFERWESTPTYRGFNTFYGYYSGSIGYASKLATTGDVDLHDQEKLVTDQGELNTHLTTLLQQKVEAAIAAHAADYFAPAGVPLFLYYAPQVGGVCVCMCVCQCVCVLLLFLYFPETRHEGRLH